MDWHQIDTLIDKHRKKPGLRGKVTAKCIECIYDPQAGGTWRQQVENCPSPSCPLYEVRPRTLKK